MQVTHIKQVHGMKCDKNDMEMREAVNSQINVIKYIRNLSSTSEGRFLVQEEGVDRTVFHQRYKIYPYCDEVNKAFPNGEIPKNFGDSTDYQKEVIHCGEASMIPFCLKEIKGIYPTESYKDEDKAEDEDWHEIAYLKMMKTLSDEYGVVLSYYMVRFNALINNHMNFFTKPVHDAARKALKEVGTFLPREIEALEKAKYYTEKEGVDKVLIIYGEDHNFTEACNKVGCDSLTSVSFEEPNGFMDSIWYYLGYDPIYTVVEEEMVLDTNGPIDNQNSYDQTGLDLGHEDL